MADESDVLLSLYVEERTQARQIEMQRALLANLILVAVGAALAFVATTGLRLTDLILTVPMIGLGLFGAVASAKYFERWTRHWQRAAGYRAQLLELHPEIGKRLNEYSYWATRSTDRFEADVDKAYPRLSRVGVYRMWIWFHSGVLVLGLAMSVVVVALDR